MNHENGDVTIGLDIGDDEVTMRTQIILLVMMHIFAMLKMLHEMLHGTLHKMVVMHVQRFHATLWMRRFGCNSCATFLVRWLHAKRCITVACNTFATVHATSHATFF